MQMEAETLSMLTWGFFIVIALSLAVIIKLWFNSKNKAFIWFVAQLVFLCFGFFRLLDLIKPKTEIPVAMMSEENSLTLGIMGVLWAASMFCMLLGIGLINKKIKS